MRSSTFSSDRVPSDHSITWSLLGLGLAFVLLSAAELLWRSDGARPTYIESHARWAWVRDQIEHATHPRRTAVIGASRILFALSLGTFEERYPGIPIAQLAVPAKGPLATLQSLAFESSFDGVVLLDFDPELFLPPREKDSADYVDFYRSRRSIDQRLNFRIANLLEPRLVTRHSYYGIDHVLRSLLRQGDLPQSPLYVRVQENRQHDADFTAANGLASQEARVAEVRGRYEQLLPRVEQSWPPAVKLLADAVSMIHARGGCVVLVRMPIAAHWLDHDRRLFSGPRYWEDVLRELGVHGIHYRDVPAFTDLPLPDGHHVDHRDQTRFTHALFDAMDKFGIHDPTRTCRPAPG